MSLDAIKKTIISEAEEKASDIESEGTKQAHAITKEAEDKAAQILKDAELNAKKEAERMHKEAQAGAEMEANSMLLEAKGDVIERSLKKVLSEAEDDISKNEMKAILNQSIKQFKEISGGSFTIKTGKKNADLLKNTAYQVEYGDVDGFMLYTDHGKIALNATVSKIVEKQADNARKLIEKEVFGESKQSAPKKKVAVMVKVKSKKATKAKGKKR